MPAGKCIFSQKAFPNNSKVLQLKSCSRAVKWYSIKWRQRIPADLGKKYRYVEYFQKIGTKDAIEGLYLIPSNNEKSMTEKEKNKGVLCNWFYKQWGRFWSRDYLTDETLGIRAKKDVKRLSETLKYTSANNLEITFPNITKVMSILLTISVTSAAVERTNSARRFIKTKEVLYKKE